MAACAHTSSGQQATVAACVAEEAHGCTVMLAGGASEAALLAAGKCSQAAVSVLWEAVAKRSEGAGLNSVDSCHWPQLERKKNRLAIMSPPPLKSQTCIIQNL